MRLIFGVRGGESSTLCFLLSNGLPWLIREGPGDAFRLDLLGLRGGAALLDRDVGDPGMGGRLGLLGELGLTAYTGILPGRVFAETFGRFAI
jgi:hypothetical protein